MQLEGRQEKLPGKETMKNSCLLPFFVVGVSAVLCAQANPSTSRTEREVMAVEEARVAALDRSDVAALDRIMADDVTYVHASGKVDTKQTYLDAIRSGQLHYISWQPKKLQVRVLGGSAAINGEYAVRVTDSRVQPDPFDISIFILTVYAKRDGRWQQIAWQSTRDVAASPAR
jgi:ketosteroid isomerase-like protein